jgi:hypothetical protein
VGGQGDAAVGDGDVAAGGAREAAHDGLAVGGQRADADLVSGDTRVVEAADGAAGAVEEFGGPAAELCLGGVQVHGIGGVRGLQVQQAAGVGAEAELGGVYQPRRAGRGDRADADGQAGRLRARGVPGHERHPGQGRGPAAGAADHFVRLEDGACGGTHPRRRARFQAGDPARLAGQDVRAVALRLGDQAGDQRFGEKVALLGEERGRGSGRDTQRGLEPGGFGRVDEAGRVIPAGQAFHPGFELGAVCGQLDVAGRAVPGVTVESGRELGPGPDPGVVQVVVGAGRLVVGVQPGEAPPAGGAARLVLVEQRHPGAGRGQPDRHQGPEYPRPHHHAPASSHSP